MQERSGGKFTTAIEDALVAAVRTELEKANNSPLHGNLSLACSISIQSNGIRCCTVQVECKSGCGYRIVAYDGEAEHLNRKALAIKEMLERGIFDYPYL